MTFVEDEIVTDCNYICPLRPMVNECEYYRKTLQYLDRTYGRVIDDA